MDAPSKVVVDVFECWKSAAKRVSIRWTVTVGVSVRVEELRGHRFSWSNQYIAGGMENEVQVGREIQLCRNRRRR